ncbi:MAG: AAA family ATPase [Planctomycetota bacterium]
MEELELLVRARYPIVQLVTHEEERAGRLVRELGRRLSKAVYEWTCTDGFSCTQTGKQPSAHHGGEVAGERANQTPMGALDFIMGSDDSALYVLKDFHSYFDNSEVVRRVRDLVQGLRRSYKTIVLQGPVLRLPVELEKDISVVDVPLPTAADLRNLLDRFLIDLRADPRFSIELDPDDCERIAQAARGLTEAQAWRVFARAAVDDRRFVASEISEILVEKKQEIRKSGILEFYDLSAGLGEVGGLAGLKRWISQRRGAFSDAAREYGLPQPRGLLLLGVQGCGKSLSAKAIAADLQVPLLRLDVGRIFSSYIGASEENMRKAIRTAEALAPVVLWIDEIEKGFAGARGGGVADSGASMRVFATFLTWLQEKTDPVFVVATANQIQELPPELLRKGRFDEIFFVDLPRPPERREILSIHLRKRRRDPAAFDLEQLVTLSEGFSGAELEQVVIDGMYAGFAEQREVTSEDLATAIESTVPLSHTMQEDIAGQRTWASTRARSAVQ